jgi:protein gp37
MILTKRPQNFSRMSPWEHLWPRNVWAGATVENRVVAQKRIPFLLELPARIRFLSCEPLLEDLGRIDLTGIDWVIIGGESGPKRRPFSLDWLERLVERCRDAGVAVFVKQDSAQAPGRKGRIPDALWIKEFPAQLGRPVDRDTAPPG